MQVLQGISGQRAAVISSIVEEFRPNLEPLADKYRIIHQDPELSCCESRTAALVADYLEGLSFEVHRNVGGHGVAGILRNGSGNTVLLRSELDALPIREETNLPYASVKHMLDSWGAERPVMHACGHDMHMACLMAASKLLWSAKSRWTGTLVVVFQPNEEHTGGAQAMVDDGLYSKVPIPDVVLGQHSIPMKSGRVTVSGGPVLAAADTIKIRFFGSLGDTLNPGRSANPIMIAAYMAVRLQSIKNSEVPPKEFAVINCEAIQAGIPGNDFLEYADLTIGVKTYSPDLRERIFQAIKRFAKAETEAAGVQKMPTIDRTVRAPLTSNSQEVANSLNKTFQTHFKEMTGTQEQRPACEDFSLLATSQDRPYAFWFFGRVDPTEWDRAVKEGTVALLPGNHSPYNAPAIQPTLRTGADALAVAALTFLGHD